MARLLNMQDLDIEMQILTHLLPRSNVAFKYTYPCSPDVQNVIACAVKEIRASSMPVCIHTICVFAAHIYAKQYGTPIHDFDYVYVRYRRACELIGMSVQDTYEHFPLSTL